VNEQEDKMLDDTKRILLVAALMAMVSAAGCARGIATGGGTIPSANPDARGATKANFGFWGDSCGESTTGNFNYHDGSVFADKKGGGLKALGPVQEVCDCQNIDLDGGDCEVLCLLCEAKALLVGWIGSEGQVRAIQSHYYSTNPKYPGEGTAYACVVDNGEGNKADADDQLLVYLDGGPYDGYLNHGNVSGNIQAFPCPD
jgi:hypothetical protein